MNEIKLGKLEKITNLRDVWKNEATDFTKWLAKDNNIKLLSDELGFNITVDETEASTGRYNVDIKAHEEETEKMNVVTIFASSLRREAVQEIYTFLTYHYKSVNAIY